MMGRVLVEAIVENLMDLWDADRGLIPPEQVRRIQLTEALVDTGATTLALPTRFVTQLGLKKSSEKGSICHARAGSRLGLQYRPVNSFRQDMHG